MNCRRPIIGKAWRLTEPCPQTAIRRASVLECGRAAAAFPRTATMDEVLVAAATLLQTWRDHCGLLSNRCRCVFRLGLCSPSAQSVAPTSWTAVAQLPLFPPRISSLLNTENLKLNTSLFCRPHPACRAVAGRSGSLSEGGFILSNPPSFPSFDSFG